MTDLLPTYKNTNSCVNLVTHVIRYKYSKCLKQSVLEGLESGEKKRMRDDNQEYGHSKGSHTYMLICDNIFTTCNSSMNGLDPLIRVFARKKIIIVEYERKRE